MSFLLVAAIIFASLFELSEQGLMQCDIIRRYDRRGSHNHIKCTGNFSEVKDLQEAVRNISDSIDVFEIYNSSLELLPEDIFSDRKNAKVRKFILSHSSLSLLAMREYILPPFHSVEKSLESLEVYNSTLVFAWDFSALSSITGLKTIIIENSDFYSVPDTFKLWPSLRFVQLTNCNVKWVHEKAFHENVNLRICSLSHNLIEEVSRSMFPRHARYLWSLDLSHNKLRSIPKHMFEDMYALKELKLDYNNLRVASDHLKPVWSDLTHLWLNGNDITCWKMCSIIRKKRKTTDRPQFFDSSTCILPPKEEILLDSFFC